MQYTFVQPGVRKICSGLIIFKGSLTNCHGCSYPHFDAKCSIHVDNLQGSKMLRRILRNTKKLHSPKKDGKWSLVAITIKMTIEMSQQEPHHVHSESQSLSAPETEFESRNCGVDQRRLEYQNKMNACNPAPGTWKQSISHTQKRCKSSMSCIAWKADLAIFICTNQFGSKRLHQNEHHLDKRCS